MVRARSLSATGKVLNKGCWCLCPAGVTLLLPVLPFSTAKGTRGDLQPLVGGFLGKLATATGAASQS